MNGMIIKREIVFIAISNGRKIVKQSRQFGQRTVLRYFSPIVLMYCI